MAQTSSPLFRLPAELRELIYLHSFSCNEDHAYCVWTNGLLLTLVDGRIYKPFSHTRYNPGRSKKCGARSLALLRTCSTVYHEALPVFHSNVELRLHVDGRYRSPIEIKGSDLGPVTEFQFLRNAKLWDITIRLSTVEDLERLIAQLQSLRTILVHNKKVEWRSISVQLSWLSQYLDEGDQILNLVRTMTGIHDLDEIKDPWREGTTVFDYQAQCGK